MICTVARLIAQRPDDNGRMITIALHHAGHALAHGGQPAGIVSETAHRHHAVGFDIGLVNHIQAIAIAKPVPQRMVWVVRAAHGVEVVLLHDFDIATHHRFVHHGRFPGDVHAG